MGKVSLLTIGLAVIVMQGGLMGAFAISPDDGGKPKYLNQIDQDIRLGRLDPVKKRPASKLPGSLLSTAKPMAELDKADTQNDPSTGNGQTRPQAEASTGEKLVQAASSGGMDWQLVFLIVVCLTGGMVVWWFRQREHTQAAE